MPPPLQGLRALELTDALGYLCGRLLVDLGVEVIKVEPPGGDPGRALAPRWRDASGREHGLYWRVLREVLGLPEVEIDRLVAEKVAW
jgi:crotonobetainyl-CoA:carnitine CoA-transferase CaiB-like acyl-CoA transferase